MLLRHHLRELFDLRILSAFLSELAQGDFLLIP
jgi:hypothetical protein